MKKEIEFLHDTKKVLRSFPGTVRLVMGQALFNAQCGDKHEKAKPLKGFGGASVLEICERGQNATYRVVYATVFREKIVVLHAFMKKSHTGVATPKKDIDLVRRRLREILDG